jgi:hypothetical protein
MDTGRLGSEPIRWRVPMAGRYLMLLVTMPVNTAASVLLMLCRAPSLRRGAGQPRPRRAPPI